MTKQEIETCINEYGKEIYSFCRHLACNLQEADDLYQDTFLKAMELDENIDWKQNPKSYLLSIALRIWKNRKRKFAWRKRIVDVCPTDSFSFYEASETKLSAAQELSPEDQFLSREEKQFVRRAVDKLPERFRVIVLLFYMEELSTDQIASLLKIPTGTVKSRLHRARKILQTELEDVLNG